MKTLLFLTLLVGLTFNTLSAQTLSKEQEKKLQSDLKAMKKNPARLQKIYAQLDSQELLLIEQQERIENQEILIADLQQNLQTIISTAEEQQAMAQKTEQEQKIQAQKKRNVGINYQVQIQLNQDWVEKVQKNPRNHFLADQQRENYFTIAYFETLKEAQEFEQYLKDISIIPYRDGQFYDVNTQNIDFTFFIDEPYQVRENIRARLDREHYNKGTAAAQERHRVNGVVQRTGKARGTDHEIFIDDLLSGRISSAYPVTSSLALVFKNAEFHDIGASIDKPYDIMGTGDAPMTHDFYYNVAQKHGLTVIAHDLNEPTWTTNGRAMDFIDSYNRKVAAGQKKPYPFKVHAVPPHITSLQQLGIDTEKNTPLILRSTNSIDIYYTPQQRMEHFRGVAESGANRPILYIFNNQIFYKPTWKTTYVLLGTVSTDFANLGNCGTDYWERHKYSRNSRNAYLLVK